MPIVSLTFERVKKIERSNPLDTASTMGAQGCQEQIDKITNYLKLGPEEDAEVFVGGNVSPIGQDCEDGFYIEPTIFRATDDMRVFQE